MTPRYFKAYSTIWKFCDAGAFLRAEHDIQWETSICEIEDMDTKEEIPAEEGEP